MQDPRLELSSICTFAPTPRFLHGAHQHYEPFFPESFRKEETHLHFFSFKATAAFPAVGFSCEGFLSLFHHRAVSEIPTTFPAFMHSHKILSLSQR